MRVVTKNMVCTQCIIVVNQILATTGLKARNVILGDVELISHDYNRTSKNIVSSRLAKIGKNTFLLLLFTLLYLHVFCQKRQSTGWVFISHRQHISKNFFALTDLQVRSQPGLEHIQTLLLRGGVGYRLSAKQSVALGYTYKGDWTAKNDNTFYTNENRIYEQYLYNTHLKRTELTFRFRQEQRFVSDSGGYNFSQRSRAFVSTQIPIAANADFSKGLYITL